MAPAPASAGDKIPAESQIIKVRVAELRQLFNAIDTSPFRERDLDPRAEKRRYLARRFTSTSRNEWRVHDGGFASCLGEVVSAC
jgi:hypothetical protein